MLEGKVCPYCFSETKYVNSSEVYKKSYGMIYLCRPCNAWVGAKGSGQALGRLANKELRQAKMQAHAYFDQLWVRKIMKDGLKKGHARAKAYKWLAEKMGIDRKLCHMGMMDVAQCKQVVEICKPYYKQGNKND